MEKIIIYPGKNKHGVPEVFSPIVLQSGSVYSVVGKTGSGKSQLIQDIESFTQGDGVTGRKI